MERELISFDLAVLAKDKGFRETCLFYFHADGTEGYGSIGKLGSYDQTCDNNWEFEGKDIKISRPTISHLQAWLREEFKIRVFPTQGAAGNYNFEIWHWAEPNGIGKFERIGNISSSTTYEEAMEKGLKLALEKLNEIKSLV